MKMPLVGVAGRGSNFVGELASAKDEAVNVVLLRFTKTSLPNASFVTIVISAGEPDLNGPKVLTAPTAL